MAPTICSSDKKRQIRAGVKDLRLHTRNTTAPAASSILNYVAKGSLHSRGPSAATLRTGAPLPLVYHSGSSAANTDVDAAGSISDSGVSSSTHEGLAPEQRRAARGSNSAYHLLASAQHNRDYSSDSPYQAYSDESLDAAENAVSAAHSISSSSHSGGCRRQHAAGAALSCCSTPQTVLVNAPIHSDKQPQLHRVITGNSSSSSNQYVPSGGGVGDKGLHNSQTYTDLCEIKNTEGLLAIAIKTIKLVKRNRLLQQRLAQLQLETSEFIQSVLANPENRHFREKLQQQGQQMEKI